MSWQKPRPRPEAGPVGRGLKAWLVLLFPAPSRAQPGLWIHRRRVHRWTDGGAAQHRAPGEYGALSLHAALPPGRSSSLDPWLRLSGPPTPSLVPRGLPGSPHHHHHHHSREDWASQSGTTPPAVTHCHTRTRPHASRSYCKLCRGAGHPTPQSRISHAGAVHTHLSHIPLHACFHTHRPVLPASRRHANVTMLNTCAFDTPEQVWPNIS